MRFSPFLVANQLTATDATHCHQYNPETDNDHNNKAAGAKLDRSLAYEHANFLTICITTALLSSRIWIEWWHLAVSNNRYSYLLLIPLLSGGIIFRNRRQIFAARAADGSLLVAAVIAWLAVACWSLAHSLLNGNLTLAVSASVTFWAATFRFLYGPRPWTAARFPILFLFLLVPIPSFVFDQVIWGLQVGSTAIANGLLSISSISYFREGLSFYFQDLTVVVTEECSGIRSSITLLLWVVLQAHLSLRSGWRKLLFLSSVVPIVLIKNGLRIATLSWLAVKVDSGFMTGWLHEDGGFVFFGLALLIELALCRLLERSEQAARAERDVMRHSSHQVAQAPSIFKG